MFSILKTTLKMYRKGHKLRIAYKIALNRYKKVPTIVLQKPAKKASVYMVQTGDIIVNN